MISQKCPKCGSKRIRRGYRPTSIFLKIFFRFHLLCDNCNWEFKGFALPIGKSSKTQGSRKRKEITNKTVETAASETNIENKIASQNVKTEGRHKKIKKKVKIRI